MEIEDRTTERWWEYAMLYRKGKSDADSEQAKKLAKNKPRSRGYGG